MIRVHHALDRVLAMYPQNTLTYTVYETVTPDEKFWVVEVRHTQVPDSLLQVEVFDDDGIPKCCVTQRLNIGRRSMFKFMDYFVNALDSSHLSEPMS